MTDHSFFPYSKHHVTEDDIAAVRDVLLSSNLTQGSTVEALEADLGMLVNVENVIACSNGTAALHLAYMALDLGPERGLLTSPITFVATANAARMLQTPVSFADVDPSTGNLDPGAVERVLRTSPTRIAAITAVHLGGRPCDMAALRQIADRFECVLIEDACHALGASYRGDDGALHPVGSCAHSDAAVFSFHAVKHVAMGEGGAVCTRRHWVAQDARLRRSHGLVRDPKAWRYPPEQDAPWYYETSVLGWNYRVTDIQCALGRSQMKRLRAGITRRHRIAALYHELLSDLPGLKLPSLTQQDEHAWHLFSISVDFRRLGRSRSTVMRALKQRGVGTQVHYIPLYHQPYYRSTGAAALPGADQYYGSTLSIPMYPELTDADVRTVAAAIRDVLTE